MLATSVLTLLFRAQGSSKSINVGVAGDAGRIFYEDSPNLFSKFHICARPPVEILLFYPPAQEIKCPSPVYKDCLFSITWSSQGHVHFGREARPTSMYTY